MDKRGWLRAMFAAFAVAGIAWIAFVGVRQGWWSALAADKVEKPWDWVERIGWVAGTALGFAGAVFGFLSWLVGRKQLAASAEVAVEKPVPEQAVPVETRPVSAAPRNSKLLDRHDDIRTLHKRLADGPWGVIVVNGPAGVGKTELVQTFVGELDGQTRVWWRDTVPGVRLSIEALIDDLEGRPKQKVGAYTLARLQLALDNLGQTPVVIVIDHADNLVNRNTYRLVDVDLDEAFDLISGSMGHRVAVLLLAENIPLSPDEGHAWPKAKPISIGGLPYKYWVPYFTALDHNGAFGLAELPHDVLRSLHLKLQGSPRLAELVYAALMTDSQFTVRKPAEIPSNDPSRFLIRKVINKLDGPQLSALEALAAYATPVNASAVAELIEQDAGNALSALHARHLVRRTSDGLYHLPASDLDWLRKRRSLDRARWTDLLHRAANHLSELREKKSITSEDDLNYHFAELSALLEIRLWRPAFKLVEEIDKILLTWNRSFLLMKPRETLRDKLDDAFWELANDNALGGIYESDGHFHEASKAYGRALRHADELNDSAAKVKIHANMAAMYWEVNKTNHASNQYTYALDEARRHGDLEVQMGALEGLANCHRRWGEYPEAIRLANEALDIPQHRDYPGTDSAQAFASSRTIAIALKLARWHAELDETDAAERFIELALEEESRRADRWLLASCLDGMADFHLDSDEELAIQTAEKAVDQAVRTRDPIILLQARTTLCLAYLKQNKPHDAARQIEGAARYRREHRSLIVLALQALTAREVKDPERAAELFALLENDATARIEGDGVDPLTADVKDFTAWDFKGFAICGRLLDGKEDLQDAVDAFKTARRQAPNTPGLTGRLRFLLRRLEKTGEPRRLKRVLDVVQSTRSSS